MKVKNGVIRTFYQRCIASLLDAAHALVVGGAFTLRNLTLFATTVLSIRFCSKLNTHFVRAVFRHPTSSCCCCC